MTLSEIRDSGLLELYIIGELSSSEMTEVEAALKAYPVLKYDLAEIESTLKVYSDAHAIEPGAHVLEELLSKTKTTASPPNESTQKSPLNSVPNSRFKFLSIATSVLFLAASALFFQQKNENRELSNRIAICDENEENANKELDIFHQINQPRNIVVELEATEKYPLAKIFFHTNLQSDRNFIQLTNLPDITDSQSYQLWSLKDGLNPIPLDVFESKNDGVFIEVKFEQNTNVYAITVEPKGGSSAPNLDNLVGTFKM